MEVAIASDIPGLIEGQDESKKRAKKNQAYGEPAVFIKNFGEFHRRNNTYDHIHKGDEHQQEVPAGQPRDLEEYEQVIYGDQTFPARLEAFSNIIHIETMEMIPTDRLMDAISADMPVNALKTASSYG